MVIDSGFSHWKWWCSIAMLVYQRVLFLKRSCEYILINVSEKSNTELCQLLFRFYIKFYIVFGFFEDRGPKPRLNPGTARNRRCPSWRLTAATTALPALAIPSPISVLPCRVVQLEELQLCRPKIPPCWVQGCGLPPQPPRALWGEAP